MKITLNKNNFEIVLNNFQSFLDKKLSHKSHLTSILKLSIINSSSKPQIMRFLSNRKSIYSEKLEHGTRHN